ncbi:cerebrin prohormone preproprotein [Elysia marginata]|uniref:Cerebrin prohormone preproprotein n=1 Tax=Elysia marginata TaxID=1093978 RepID=A0AAV4GHM1_9GAST|nr:cerebrin prohormone preproprotein [Elysia marginata]
MATKVRKAFLQIKNMHCFKAVNAVVVLAVLVSTLLVQVSNASVVRPYRSQRPDNIAEEVIRRLSEVIRLVRYDQEWTDVSKRNPGTADTLYNLPMLDKIGRRR